MSKKERKVSPELERTVRYQALEILLRVRKNQAYSNLMIKKTKVEEKDRALLAELVYGTISRRYTLEYILSPFIQGKKVQDWVQELLLLALYQLLFLDRIPNHAVVDESVKIAKEKGNPGIGKFVNGVLRNLLRSDLKDPRTIQDPIERLSIMYSVPKDLVSLIVDQYGKKEAEALLASLLTPSHASARLTKREGDREDCLEALKKEGFSVKESPVSPYGIIAATGHLAGSKAFKEGRITIQDESSMLVAPALQVEPQHQVLDACAAPGGKTGHIASYLDATQGGKVTALDIHQHKCELIEETAERLHVSDRVTVQTLDARKVGDTFAKESFDRILVDAPCSGLGLMRRKPDIKYSKSITDLSRLSTIQLQILNACAPCLKQGGIMVYSTCTINKEENEAVVTQFLKEHPEFTLIPVQGAESIPSSVHPLGVTILPHQYHTDGFFISCLQKSK